MDKEVCQRFTALLVHELIPALGCTEPIAIAYCTSCAASLLEQVPEKIILEASSNIIKNVKSVIVPNSHGMKGIEAAAILGALARAPERKLEVLEGLEDEQIVQAARLLSEGICEVRRLESPHPLHIIARCQAGGHEALAEICDQHTHLVRLALDGENTIEDHVGSSTAEQSFDFSDLQLKDLIDYAEEGDFGEAEDSLQRQLKLNLAIAEEGLSNKWGANIGQLHKTQISGEEKAYTARKMAIAMASAGSDARMSGCDLPVVINSGSGNQGMTVSMPPYAYARVYDIPRERLMKALALANLIALYQKNFIGRLSAFCGAVSAAVGSVCGIAWMLGGDEDLLQRIINNTLGTISGMVCDGAKASCAAKIAAALNVAFDAYELAERGISFANGDGIVKASADETIRAVGRMARLGMRATDAEIIDIMLSKTAEKGSAR